MARPPKTIEIADVWIEPPTSWGWDYVHVGPDIVLPARFTACCRLTSPATTVALTIVVGYHHQPAVVELRVSPARPNHVTTAMVRHLPMTHLLQAALAKATVPMPAPDPAPAATPGDDRRRPGSSPAAGTNGTGGRHAEADAQTAARVYQQALAWGSTAPAVAVATAMNRSRSQVARYLRRARELGLLPPRPTVR